MSKVQHASNGEDFHQLLDSDKFDFRYDCGVPKPSSLFRMIDRDTILSSIAMHYSIIKSKAELDQLVQGLETLQGEFIT